jgi:photosystem II stability/assembly factor-like uncharacterized protein
MVQVVFTPNLQRHVSCPPVGVTGSTVAEALSSVFDDNPRLRRYVLDDQGALRKNMVIFVDGRVVVLRTRDGGKSFQRLTDGLPQEHAYDICFRHALDVDASGERLALGSTTGSLWMSENGGDGWECVSSHLPPIYALRFTQ